MMRRRVLFAIAVIGSAFAATGAANAQTYPDRPIPQPRVTGSS